MAMAELARALELVEDHPERCFFVGPREEPVVSAAEDALGIAFPSTYRRFLRHLGAGNVGAEEIYGVIDEDFVDSAVPDEVWMTLEGRREWGLPDSLVVISFDGGTDYFVLDTAQVPHGEEAPVWCGGPARRDPATSSSVSLPTSARSSWT